jgi:hypothetical protein
MYPSVDQQSYFASCVFIIDLYNVYLIISLFLGYADDIATKPIYVDQIASNISASAVNTNKCRSLYDIFSLPCSPSTYIPNERLRNLYANYTEVSTSSNASEAHWEMHLRMNLVSHHGWNFSESETVVNNPNLSIYLGMINSMLAQICEVGISAVTTGKLPFKAVLASSSSKSEYRIQKGQMIIVASEAKGVEDSIYEALAQGFQLGADSAVHLWRNFGMHYKDCVVPVVLCYGDCFHICAVYLLPECYPVIVQLSSPICYLTIEGRLCAVRWATVLSQFAKETIKFD